ncbi:MAG: hypothetical protein Q9201_005170 [Fulgogasparrea decipioides]
MTTSRICGTCTSRLLNLYHYGFCAKAPAARIVRPKAQLRRFALSHDRRLTTRSQTRQSNVHCSDNVSDHQQLSHTVTRTRQTFGDTLPEGFLSSEEYRVYERLYGPPAGVTRPHDIALLQDLARGNQQNQIAEPNILFREDDKGNLEKVGYAPKAESELVEAELEYEEVAEEGANHPEHQLESPRTLDSDFDERFAIYRDRVAASGAVDQSSTIEQLDTANGEDYVAEEGIDEGVEELEELVEEYEDVEGVEEAEYPENVYTSSGGPRRHPLTTAGKWGTSPMTIQLPKDTFIDPVSAVFSEASNKHLTEVTRKVFGGRALPNSTATLSPNQAGENLKQSPIALEASQSHMGEMEANAYLAAIMPGAYATVLGCLTEVRKRLGPQWVQDLLKREGGPRVLDAGAGGAGVLAWRELLRTEWEIMHPNENVSSRRVPFGKSTVVTGSASLRQRSSLLLDNTTFLPRLPDYNPRVDHPSLEHGKGTPRKQYDVILAPYTLWTLQEDHMRKAHIQNLWSLLKSDGGVLIVIEKGVPRGFELVAGAREVLLKFHIASPGDTKFENRIDEPIEGRYREKEVGMIIAPCTNHGKCPMYLFSGKSVGRRDSCHFSQRFIRPPFLQRIVDQSHHNHEDIRFSFVAVQRGLDQRQVDNFKQGQEAEDDAFAGFDEGEFPESARGDESDPQHAANDGGARMNPINPLSFPRIVLPPLKKRGHIILDACTPAGKIERWTVPKSYGKQAYADARKARWGDLWALGAKTRIARRVRIGREKVKTRKRTRFEANISDPDNIREIGRGSKVKELPRKERRPRHKSALSDDDIDE